MRRASTQRGTAPAKDRHCVHVDRAVAGSFVRALFVSSFGCLFREPSVNGRAVGDDPHPRGGYNRAILGLLIGRTPCCRRIATARVTVEYPAAFGDTVRSWKNTDSAVLSNALPRARQAHTVRAR